MTTRTPTVVHTVNEAWLGLTSDPLPNVKNLVATADIDAQTFASATLTLGPVTDELWAQLDPRDGVTVAFKSTQYDMAGNVLGALPTVDSGNDVAELWLRSARRDHITGEVTLELAGGESMLDDKKRISGNTINTGATTVSELVYWSLLDVFGSLVIIEDVPVLTTSIPAGDRRLMVQGESHAELLQPELDAINCRLIDAWGRTWGAYVRSATYGTPLKLATYDGAPSDADPCVTELTEELSRDGEWADGVLIEYTPPGSAASTWQRSGAGANTRGMVIRRDRAAPGGNAANQIVNRTQIRGYDLQVTARLRYEGVAFATTDYTRPQTLQVYTPDRTLTGRIRSVQWDTLNGLMTIRAQTGDPIT